MSFKHIQHILFVTILSCFSVFAFGQAIDISGTVIDADTKETLPFVTVAIEGTTQGTITSMDGTFKITSASDAENLIFSFVGYDTYVLPIVNKKEKKLMVELKSTNIVMEEVKIVADKKAENPAHPIIRRMWEEKDNNNSDKLEAYQYEVYNKVEFDMNNLTEKFVNRKVFKSFKFIFDNIDSTGERPFLPMFITESISDYYFRKNPKAKFENIKATQVSGLENESISQFLGDMYQSVNIYDNNLRFFGKSFVSPLSTAGLIFYRYYLIDSLPINGIPSYHIKFIPQRKVEPTFLGEMWIAKGSYAIAKIQGDMAGDANINFIRGFSFGMEYKQVEPGTWMLSRDNLVVDFSLTENVMGLYGRKTTSYDNFVINQPQDDKFYLNRDPINVAEDHRDKASDFWENNRHEELSESEASIYQMVDSIKQVPRFNTYLDIINIIFTGYKEVGYLEFGPYSKIYSYNPIEGNRFRAGVRTSNKFSKTIALGGFGAYGLKDQKWKYGGNFTAILNKDKWTRFDAEYSKDVKQLGQSPDAFDQDNVFSSVFRRNPATKLTLEETWSAELFREWVPGISNTIGIRQRKLDALGDLIYIRPKIPENNFTNDIIPSITATELTLHTRFAFQERFIRGEFNRVSLGTKYPKVDLNYTLGLKGFLEGDYDYHKVSLVVHDETPIGLLGDLNWRAEVGKIWGNAPYPLQKIHTGNETFFFQDLAFNTMNFFEFVSDEYVTLHATHHFEGLFFNHFPLLRKLKWREVVTAKAVWGRFDEQNNNSLILPDYISSLEAKPFAEAAVGIENIFKFLRIDAMWRLSYLDNPDIVKFGIRAKIQLMF